MTHKPTKLTVTDSRHFHVADVIRNNHGDIYYVSARSTWVCRRPIHLRWWQRLWSLLRGRGWRPTTEFEQHTVRVWPWQRTGLKRRLP